MRANQQEPCINIAYTLVSTSYVLDLLDLKGFTNIVAHAVQHMFSTCEQDTVRNRKTLASGHDSRAGTSARPHTL